MAPREGGYRPGHQPGKNSADLRTPVALRAPALSPPRGGAGVGRPGCRCAELAAEVERLRSVTDIIDPDSVYREQRDQARAEVEGLRADLADLRLEWGWDVSGRKRSNPEVIRGGDGRPVVERPSVVDGVRLFSRRVSGWEPAS